MDDSLIAEAGSVISVAPVVPLGFGPISLSLLSVKIVAQTPSEVTHGLVTMSVVRKTPPVRCFVRRGFLRRSSSIRAHGCSSYAQGCLS
jgi:hypothetical protein